MHKKPIVAGIGEFLWDMLPSGKQLGGAPCNFAFHAMLAGCESIVISAIGRDALGDELLKTLNELNINDQYIQKNEFPTSTVTVKLDSHGHPDYTIHEQVAWDHIRWTPSMREVAGDLDAVCFGSLAQRENESATSILSLITSVRPDCLKVFDINLRQRYYNQETILRSIIHSDVLKLNDDELPVVAGYTGIAGDVDSQLGQLVRLFDLKYIVYTMGSKGSIIVCPDDYSLIEAPKVLVADSVGAGDAFTAVFIAGILNGFPLDRVHRKATEIAAMVCTQKGATPRLPTVIF